MQCAVASELHLSSTCLPTFYRPSSAGRAGGGLSVHIFGKGQPAVRDRAGLCRHDGGLAEDATGSCTSRDSVSRGCHKSCAQPLRMGANTTERPAERMSRSGPLSGPLPEHRGTPAKALPRT